MNCPNCGSKDINKDGLEYDCDTCGYYWVVFEGSKWKKSNKEYKCLNCQSVIQKGTRYYRVGFNPTLNDQAPKPGPYCNEYCVGQASFRQEKK